MRITERDAARFQQETASASDPIDDQVASDFLWHCGVKKPTPLQIYNAKRVLESERMGATSSFEIKED